MWQRLRIAYSSRSSRATLIKFSDVKPRSSRLAWFWHGIGIDHRGMIYAAIGNGEERRSGYGDVLIFAYDTRSGRKVYLESVCDILAAADNLGPNRHWPRAEGVAKVHSDIIEHNSVMYFSTHDLHDADKLQEHRGGHFMSFDPATGQFCNLSAACPGGVAIENEGIIGLNVLKQENALVGWTYPYGHVLLYELETGRLTKFERGPTDDRVANVARIIAVTRTGSVFAAYTGPNAPNCFFRLDRNQGRLQPTQYEHDMGFLEGMAQTSDGATIYLSDTNGELYSIDAATEVVTRLGSILPPERMASGEQVEQLRNLTLSRDEEKLFTIPTRVSGGAGAYHLYEYDIRTGIKSTVADLRAVLKDGMLTGNGVTDEEGRMYLSCYFGSDGKMYRSYGELSGLARIDVSDRMAN